MPSAPRRPCTARDCPNLQPCSVHVKQRWSGDRSTLSSHARGYGAYWRRLREVVRAREPLCRTCRRRPMEHLDHVIPKELGGTDDLSNLAPICKPCHALKTAREGRAARRR